MKMKHIKLLKGFLLLISSIIIFVGSTAFVFLGDDGGKKITRLPINGHGVFVAGDFWTDIVPINKEVWYRQFPTTFVNTLSTGNVSQPVASQNQTLFRLGNTDRNWQEPITQWPSGFWHGNYWNTGFEMAAYDPSPTFNDATKASYWKVAGSNYAYAFYTNKLAGAGDPKRDFAEETKWVDATQREQVIYRCGYPTNLGIDIQLTARQFTCNWNNLNDFVLYEFTFTNTGILDVDGNGTPEKTDYTPIITFGTWREVVNASGGALLTGIRGTDWGGAGMRMSGYIGDNDPDGEPWDISLSFAGTQSANVNPNGTIKGPGKNDQGIQATGKIFLDRWMGMNWIAVKQGDGNPANQDKQTIFGTHPIGTGAQRGWYHSAGQGQNLIVGSRYDGINDGTTNICGPKISFIAFAGSFYLEGGKSKDKTKLIGDPKPNPKFFEATGGEDVTQWKPLPEAQRQRPDGDYKLISEDATLKSVAWPQNWEDGTMDASGNKYPNGWGKWTKGYSHDNNFEASMFTGIGPFKLAVGEKITIMYAEFGGFRLEGIQKACRAARWVWKNGFVAPPQTGGAAATAYNLPFKTPPAPDLVLEGTPNATVIVRWDNKAETDPQFAGYKIWRSTTCPPKFEWTKSGMRVSDKYQEQMEIGFTKDAYLKPMNPKFDAWADIAAQSTKGQAQGQEWGPYELILVIPKADLSKYTEAKTVLSKAYNYKWEDTKVVYSFEYWYYIAAYKEGSYTGPGNETTTRIETSNFNRNGRSGLWLGTYSYADNNAFFPGNYTTTFAGIPTNVDQAKKEIGARYTVRQKTASLADINSGAIIPKVIPNPYKTASSADNYINSAEHKIRFFNLPATGKITILDVAGQIVDQIEFNNTTGVSDVTWDMFSKDGNEIANGLYIFIVEGGLGTSGTDKKFTYVGKFAVLR